MLKNNFKINTKSNIFAYILALTVYSTEPFKHFVWGSNFAIDIYLISVSIFGILFLNLNKNFLRIYLIIILILLLSFILVIIYNYDLNNFIRQALGVSIVYLGLGSLILKIDKEKLIKAYMNLALLVAILGLIQWSLSFLEIADVLIKVPGRLDSITYEPSHYAVTTAPALFLFIRDYLLKRSMRNLLKMIIIILSFLLTFSITAYLILFLIIIFLLINYKSFLLISFFSFLLLVTFINTYKLDIKTFKFDSISNSKAVSGVYKKMLILSDSISQINKIDDMESPKNLTIYSLFINLNAAKTSLYSGRILGSGFGTHSQIIKETVPKKFRNAYYYQNQIFNTNGYSLFIRIISEFGLVGIFLYMFFVIKGLSRNILSISIYDTWWLIGSVHMISLILKTTSFVDNGTPIFLLVPLLINNKILINEK